MCGAIILCTISNDLSNSIRVGHSSDFWPFSVAILPWLCDVKQYTLTLENTRIRRRMSANMP